ncbi:MAG TPA: GNAT family N-acetyltransferase [Streptosporangiaceae bacterium]|nr:GNAT family N-acetyltransferase [Streptosporangiaceae bacterium]
MTGSRRPAAPGPGRARPARIRPLTLGDDLEAELDLARRAFGPLDDAGKVSRMAETRAAVADGRYYAAVAGEDLVAVALYHDMRQWWHGRSLRMAGVGGVKVAPEQRGRGIGSALMSELLQVIAGLGYPLSALFPATAPIYRALGWELAGGLYRAVVPARSLASLAPWDDAGGAVPELRRAGPGDADAVIGVIGGVHESARHCGPATHDAGTLRRWWLDDENLFCYLAPDGFLAYGWHGGRSELLVRWALAGSAPTTRAIWSTIGSHASIAERVRAVVGPDDPVGWLTREPDVGMVRREPWMLRVVDAAAAIAGRGFPGAAELAVRLQLDDAQLPGNAGRWTLEISGGKGALSASGAGPGGGARRGSGGAGPVRLGARGFAALYAGTPMATLRRAGLAAGGDAGDDDALDTAFAGQAFLLDDF